jgi:hypothetical protein
MDGTSDKRLGDLGGGDGEEKQCDLQSKEEQDRQQISNDEWWMGCVIVIWGSQAMERLY